MPARRFGSARRELHYDELMHLTIGACLDAFPSEQEAEAAYWQHRDQVLRFGNQQPGHRPEGFWRFEARWTPPPDPDPRHYDIGSGDILEPQRRVELARLQWLRDHGHLEDWERAKLLEWARKGKDGTWWKYRSAELLDLLDPAQDLRSLRP
jgi:hypothetical protein